MSDTLSAHLPAGAFGDALRTRIASGSERYVVTGAGGWLGRVALDLLADALGLQAEGRIAAFATHERAVAAGGATVLVRSMDGLDEAIAAADRPTVLPHFAFLTPDRLAEIGLAEFVRRNTDITVRALRAVTACSHVLLASSGAVYGAPELAQNPYGALKRVDEQAFAEACRRGGARLVVPRIFNVSGPHLADPGRYALGAFVRAAVAGGPIVVEATRPVVRSYMAIADVLALSLSVLLAGDAPPATRFDTAGDEEIELGALAELVAGALGPGIAVRREIWDPEAAEDRYAGDGAALEALCAHHGLRRATMLEQIAAMAADLRLRSVAGTSG